MSALFLWQAVHEVLSNSPKKVQLDRKQSATVQHLVNVLRQWEEEELEVEESIVVDRIEDEEEDPDYDPLINSSAQYVIPTDPDNPVMCRIGDQLVDVDQVQQAVNFYGSFGDAERNGKVRPSWSTVNKKFPFIKKEQHLRKLAEFERNGMRINLHNAIKWVSGKLYEKVEHHLEQGHILHDRDLRSMAMEIVAVNNLDIRFKASDSWIASWKKAHRITSRKITKFVSRKRFVDAAVIQKKSEDCVKHVQHLMKGYKNDEVYNADQSGFVCEMHTMRTLARTGSKDVPVVVRSESNMKKSYTVMPLVNADGGFAPKMFVVLKEPNGTFPAKGIFKTHNLIVKAYTTHMMTKGLMVEFFQDCVFDPKMPRNMLLLVDSWSSWKDSAAIESVKPRTRKLKTVLIPPGCTGLIQPLDVGVFGQFKRIIKIMNAYAQRNHPDFHLSVRDNTLKVISLVFWQLSHPSLKEWVKQAWYSSGYITQHPLKYDTPTNLLFPLDVAQKCQIQPCCRPSFIICLYCSKKICFHHFVEEYHNCS